MPWSGFEPVIFRWKLIFWSFELFRTLICLFWFVFDNYELECFVSKFISSTFMFYTYLWRTNNFCVSRSQTLCNFFVIFFLLWIAIHPPKGRRDWEYLRTKCQENVRLCSKYIYGLKKCVSWFIFITQYSHDEVRGSRHVVDVIKYKVV
jgi:hypothetical protein